MMTFFAQWRFIGCYTLANTEVLVLNGAAVMAYVFLLWYTIWGLVQKTPCMGVCNHSNTSKYTKHVRSYYKLFIKVFVSQGSFLFWRVRIFFSCKGKENSNYFNLRGELCQLTLWSFFFFYLFYLKWGKRVGKMGRFPYILYLSVFRGLQCLVSFIDRWLRNIMEINIEQNNKN